MQVTIIGGGSSAHLLSVLLSRSGHEVSILTSHPERWHKLITLMDGSRSLVGEICVASDCAEDVIPRAQVIFLCMPVHQYVTALRRALPLLNRECLIGPVYGQAGFDWMVRGLARMMHVEVPHYFAIGLLPWIVRTEIYGQRAITYGPKLRNGIATSGEEVFTYLRDNILDDLSVNFWGTGSFERIPSFLTLTLTVDNQIIHPSRCYALMQGAQGWSLESSVPYFYRDWDVPSTRLLRGIDDDYTSVRNALAKLNARFNNPYNLNYLELEHWSYGSHSENIRESFVQSKTLHEIKPPVVRQGDRFVIDVDHRFFYDDFNFGVVICHWLAQKLHCNVPHIEKLMSWYEENVKPFQSKKIALGVPELYGMSFADVINSI